MQKRISIPVSSLRSKSVNLDELTRLFHEQTGIDRADVGISVVRDDKNDVSEIVVDFPEDKEASEIVSVVSSFQFSEEEDDVKRPPEPTLEERFASLENRVGELELMLQGIRGNET